MSTRSQRAKQVFSAFSTLLVAAEKREFVILIVLMIVGAFLEVLGIGLVAPVIAKLLMASHPGSATAVADTAPAELPVYLGGGLALLIAVYFVKCVFMSFLTIKQVRYGQNIQKRLANRLLSKYLQSAWDDFIKRNPTELANNVSYETMLFVTSYLTSIMVIVKEGLVLIAAVALLLYVEPLGALSVIALLGGASLAILLVTRRRVYQWGLIRHVWDVRRSKILYGSLNGAKDAKLFGREAYFVDEFAKANDGGADVVLKQTIVGALPRFWFEFLVILALTFLIVVMQAQGKSVTVILTTCAVFSAAAFRIMPSVYQMLQAFQNFRFGMPAAERVVAEMALPDEDRMAGANLPGGRRPVVFQSAIDIRNVSYRYGHDQTTVLKGVSLTIAKHARIGMMGLSGAGKSTMVDLLLGLLRPVEGDVLVDGVSIYDNIRSWRAQCGYVTQSIYLLDDTLKRNVAFGLADEDIDEEAVRRAVTGAQLDDVVRGLPEGLETVVGERGVRLSGGQRQRLGIARALYNSPSVLVLDEATSALDLKTEDQLLKTITGMNRDTTLIMIAHRETALRDCDVIYEMRDGALHVVSTADRGRGAA
jgi:ATP-binding cassette, subfamily B, bacterial PglK